jgi:cobalt-zinc-cadmium efflux system protein
MNKEEIVMGHHHGHGHSHSHSHDSSGNIGTAFFLNLSFTIIELIGGILTNSVAIISDAVHDFGDSISLALAWYFQKVSKKGSNRFYSYGYKRFSLLGAIITSVVLVGGSIFILTEAVPRIFEPQETNAKGMFVLAVAGILINGAAVLRTRKGSSINEKLVSLHLLEDVLGWIAVLAGSVLIHFTGLTIFDPILSIAISIFVLFNVFRNIRQVIPIILQGTPRDLDLEHIAEEIKQINTVADVHDLHIWSLTEEYNVLTVHVLLEKYLPMADLAELKKQIRSVLNEEGIQHATIEFETSDEQCAFENCLKEKNKSALR